MAASVQDLVDDIRKVVDVTEADALAELDRRHLQMWLRGNPAAPTTLLPAALTLDGGPATIFTYEDLKTNLVDAAVATFLRRQGEGDPATLEALFQAACDEYARRVLRYEPSYTGVSGLLIRIREVVGDVSKATVLTEINERVSQMWRVAHPRDTTTVLTPLVETSTDAEIVVPMDLRSQLMDGVIATFIRRRGQGDPSLLEARFAQGAEEWRKRVRRADSSGPDTILVPC